MKTFKDAAAKEWAIELTIGRLKAIFDRARADGLDVNLLQPQAGQPPLIQRLHDDLFLFVYVLYHAVADQAAAEGLDFEGFTRRLTGAAGYDAQQAFEQEWEDFFLGLHRPELAKVVQTHREMVAKGTEVATRKYQQAAAKAETELARLDAMTLEELEAKFGGGATSGNSPASVDSTPAA